MKTLVGYVAILTTPDDRQKIVGFGPSQYIAWKMAGIDATPDTFGIVATNNGEYRLNAIYTVETKTPTGSMRVTTLE